MLTDRMKGYSKKYFGTEEGVFVLTFNTDIITGTSTQLIKDYFAVGYPVIFLLKTTTYAVDDTRTDLTGVTIPAITPVAYYDSFERAPLPHFELKWEFFQLDDQGNPQRKIADWFTSKT